MLKTPDGPACQSQISVENRDFCRRNIAITFGMKKTKMVGLQHEKSLRIYLLVSTEYTKVTDTQMDRRTSTTV